MHGPHAFVKILDSISSKILIKPSLSAVYLTCSEPGFMPNLDFIFIDSLHEANHVEKVFYNYYSFLKKEGICVIDDVSWLSYSKNQYRDNEFSEYINRSTFNKILENLSL